MHYRWSPLIRILFVGTCLMGSPAAYAQGVEQTAVAAWVDDALAKAKAAGALTATHGEIVADTGAGSLSIKNIELTYAVPAIGTEPVKVSIGAIKGEKVVLKDGRFLAGRLVIEKVVLTTANGSVTADVLDLTQIDAAARQPQELAALDARGMLALFRDLRVARASLPEMVGKFASPDAELSFVQRGNVSEEIANGKVKLSKFSGFDITMKDKTSAPMSMKFGAGSLSQGDIAASWLMLLGDATLPADRPMQTLYESATFAGGNFDLGTVKGTIGAIASKAAKARIPRIGILEYFTLANKLNAKTPDGKPISLSPEDGNKLIDAVRDYMTASYYEEATLDGFTLTADSGKFAIDRFEIRDVNGANYRHMQLIGLSGETPEAKMSLQRLTVTDLNYNDFLIALMEGVLKDTNNPDFTKLEGKLLSIGAIEATKLSFTEGDEEKLSFGKFRFELGNWVGLLPGKLRIMAENFVVPGSVAGEDSSPSLEDLGLDNLDQTFDIQFGIDPATKRATLSPVVFSLANAGGISVDVALKNVDGSQLGLAGLMNYPALLETIEFDKASLRFENKGIFERYIKWQADEQEVKPAQVSKELLAGVKGPIELLIPDAAAKKQAQAAIDAFGANPRSLTIKIAAKGKLTLGALQSAGTADPFSLLPLLNIGVTSND